MNGMIFTDDAMVLLTNFNLRIAKFFGVFPDWVS